MGIALHRPKIDIVESVVRCVESPSVSCCSRSLFRTTILLWHLIKARGWLTTKELCSRTKIRCNMVRVYLYRLKKKGIVVTSKIHTGETIWKINDKALKGLDPKDILKLLAQHYKICKEYYKTGVLKKPE